MEFEKLKKVIADVLNVDPEEITMESTFVDDLGADSLDIFQIIMGIEEEFDIEMPSEEVEQIVSVGDAVEEIHFKRRRPNKRRILFQPFLLCALLFCSLNTQNKQHNNT